MGPGRKICRTGLLTMKTNLTFRIMPVIFLLMFPPGMSAQDTGPQVSVETYPETPEVGVPWFLTLFVNNSVPDDVTVIMPPFAGFLSSDRIRKTPRITETQVQTVIEYRFVPNNAGRFILESFTVITSEGIAETGPLVLEIRGSGAEQKPSIPRIVWEGAPRQMAAGERTALALRVYGWNSSRPPQEFFMPEVPQGAILFSSPLSAEEREGGTAVKLNLIPLDGDFYLPARVLQHENFVFEIPALHIRVTGRSAGETAVGEQPLNSETVPGKVHAQFPDFDSAAFDKPVRRIWRGQGENIYNTARGLWDNGFYAQALAELRRNERDHPAGALLQPIRREAEKNLGLLNTENESRWKRKFLLGLSFFFFLLVIITPFVCSIFIRDSPWKRAALICAVVFTVLGSFYIYLFVDSRSVFYGKNSRFGVTSEIPVRRTADIDGEELFSFREGQPVVIMLNSGSWVYARANDAGGSSGWIPAEAVIFY